MKYELRKIIGNRYFCISLVLSLVVNGFFLLSTYNGDRSGYTLTELKKAYSNIDQLKTKQADLDAAITGLCEYRGDLLTGDIYEEYFLVSTTIERIAEAKEYSDHLSNILAELQVKINSGLFGNTESYSVKAFRAVMHQYEKLKNINIPISFSGAIEILSGWEVSDILIFLFCCTAALLLTTSERKNGSLGLLYSTENGRSKLYIQKYFATEVIYALTFLLMHGCNISLTCITLGYGDIMRPIQSVYGFSDCPFGFTVFGYFVFYYLIKFLWGLSVSTLFFAFCSATHNFILPIFSIGSIFLFSYACEFSHVLYFHFLNLIHLAKTEDLFKSCIMLNFGGRPISHLIVLFFELALISLLSFTFGMIHFCSKQMANKTRGKRNAHPFSALRHTNLFIHEGTKIYIHNHALIIIVTFVILQVCVYREFTVTLNETEVEYKRYSDILTGLPNKEKKHYLESEMAYFEDLETQLFLLEERFGEDKAILSLISRETQQKLQRKEAFILAKDQYNSLQNGMSYVYRSGYERLYNTQGTRDNIRNTAFFLFFLSLVLSSVFSFERETNVYTIHNTLGLVRSIAIIKWIHVSFILLFLSIIAYMPQYIAINNTLGLTEVAAKAKSLSYFSAWPGNWTIFMTLVATYFARISIGILSAITTFFIARKADSTIITLMISFGIALVPLLLACLLI